MTRLIDEHPGQYTVRRTKHNTKTCLDLRIPLKLHHVWDKINEFVTHTKENGFFVNNRKIQSLNILTNTIKENLKSNFYNNRAISKLMDSYKQQISNPNKSDNINPYEIAQLLLDKYFNEIK